MKYKLTDETMTTNSGVLLHRIECVECFGNVKVGDMVYYFYDPTKHGYAADKKYPLLIFLHGAGNSFQKEICINYSGGELYASSDYQEKLGGAYVLIPLANEKRDEEGRTVVRRPRPRMFPKTSLWMHLMRTMQPKLKLCFALNKMER